MDIFAHLTPVESTPPPEPPPSNIGGWRWLHGAEGGRMPPLGMPEIVAPIDQVALEMSRPIQLIAFYLAKALNPHFTPQRYTRIHLWDTAMNNGAKNGYGNDGWKNSNWVTLEDLNSPPPRYDKMQRGFGGSWFDGYNLRDRVRCVPGVHGFDARVIPDHLVNETQVPSSIGMDAFVTWAVREILEHHWYVIAVSIGRNDPTQIVDFAQGDFIVDGEHTYGIVAYPFIFDRDIEFWMDECTPWSGTDYPDHKKLYKPIPSERWQFAVRD